MLTSSAVSSNRASLRFAPARWRAPAAPEPLNAPITTGHPVLTSYTIGPEGVKQGLRFDQWGFWEVMRAVRGVSEHVREIVLCRVSVHLGS